VAEDLEAVAADVERTLGVERCFRDPGVAVFGLHNVLFPIGDTFLEIVSPTEAGTTAGRQLERRQGDGGYMVILQTDDLEATRALATDADVRIVFEAVGGGIVGLHFHPRDVGGAILSIDQPDEPAEWHWAGPVWRDHVRTDVVSEIVEVTIQAEDPAAMAARWAAVIGASVDGGSTSIALDRGVIRFVPVTDGRGEGVCGLACSSPSPDRVGTAVDVGGVNVTFIAEPC